MRAPGLVAFLAYALGYLCLLPRQLTPRSDDFGYLDSVLLTLQSGQLANSNWLEPYNATLTALSALITHLTGDLYLGTFGVLAVLSLLNFVLLYQALGRHVPEPWRALLTLALATTPSYLGKTLDYTGLVPSLTLWLGAYLAFRGGYLGRYVLIGIAAFATRQSAIVLLLWPAWAALGRPADRGKLLGAAALMALGDGIVARLMPVTYAQTHVTAGLWAAFRPDLALLCLGLGLSAMLATLALGHRLAVGQTWAALLANLRRPWPALAASALFLAWLWAARTPELWSREAPTLDRMWQVAIGLALMAAWVADYPALARALRAWQDERLGLLLVGVAGVGLVALRGHWWDYYLLEPVLAALLVALSLAPWSPRRRVSVLALVGFTGVLAVHGTHAYRLRCDLDRESLAVHVYEQLIRSGRMAPAAASMAPWGYAGWRFFEAYLASNPPPYRSLSDFYEHTVRWGDVIVEAEVPWKPAFPRALAPGDRVLATGSWSVGCVPRPFRVVDLASTHSVPLRELPGRALPLSSAEWRAYLAGVPLKPVPEGLAPELRLR